MWNDTTNGDGRNAGGANPLSGRPEFDAPGIFREAWFSAVHIGRMLDRRVVQLLRGIGE
jgi:hypothetical protein